LLSPPRQFPRTATWLVSAFAVVVLVLWSPFGASAFAVAQFHTVTFAENDSLSDSTTVTQTENSPTALTLFSAISPPFTNSGHTFVDWNTEPDGSGTTFANGGTYGFGSGIELYAIWESSSSITIDFDLSGGVGSNSPLTGAQGSTETLPSGVGISKVGYDFSGWNTTANGTGSEYLGGQSVVLNSNETLYAQWTIVATSQPSPPAQQQVFQVAFEANGGSGSLSPMSGVAGVALTLPSPTNLLRPGYSFTSWNTDANGTGTSYASGASLTLSSSLTLYAQWKATPTSVLYGDVGVFDKNSTGLTKTLQQQVEQLAATIRMKKFTKVALYGYTAQTGLPTLDAALSHDRALSVARYLRLDLRHLHVRGVDIRASGEGAISSSTSSLFSRVEVFVS